MTTTRRAPNSKTSSRSRAPLVRPVEPEASARPSAAAQPDEPRAPLLHRLAGGDPEAVREALDTFGTLVLSIARRHHADRGEAEDAVQEIFVDLWRTGVRFDPNQGSEATFVATVAHRRCIDRHRRAEARPRFEDIETSPERAVESQVAQVESEEESDLVRGELARLRAPQRRVLELSFLAGLSHSQIAEVLGMPLGTVKTHARRGLQRLQDALSGTSLAASNA